MDAPTVDVTDVFPDPRNTPVAEIELVFNEAVTGLDVADLSLARDGGENLLTGAEPLSTTDSITWTLGGLLPVTGESGEYVLTLTAAGSGIQDAVGNALADGASDTWAADMEPPTADIIDVSPDPRNLAVDQIRIVFSEPVVGLDPGDLALSLDGGPDLLTGTEWLDSPDDITWTISPLGDITDASGTYTFMLPAAGSGITDAAGNAMQLDASDTWVVDAQRPTADITDVAPDPRNSPVDAVEIVFSEAISGFDAGDLSLTRNGGQDLLTGGESLATTDNIVWTLSGLSGLTAAGGDYVLTLTAAGSGIQDAVGNLLEDDASDTWFTDTEAPTADIVDVTPDPRDSAVEEIEIVFDEAVTGFDLADLSLARDGGENLLTGGEALNSADNIAWTLSGLSGLTGESGVYTLTLTAAGSGIEDAAGNALAGDASETWTADVQPLTADAWFSAAAHGSVGEVLLAIPDDGTFSEARMAGVARLVIEFSEAIDAGSFTPSSVLLAGNDATGSAVDLSGIGISTSTSDGQTVGVIDFAPALPDAVRYLVQIEGVTDAAGNPLSGDANRVFTSLAGDASGDLRVNAIDLSYIWPRRRNQIDGVTVEQTRSDVTGDGRVNAIDLSAAWPRRGGNMQQVSDPVLLPAPGGAGASGGALDAAAALWLTTQQAPPAAAASPTAQPADSGLSSPPPPTSADLLSLVPASPVPVDVLAAPPEAQSQDTDTTSASSLDTDLLDVLAASRLTLPL